MCDSGISTTNTTITDTHELIDISADEQNDDKAAHVTQDIEIISVVQPSSSSSYSRLWCKRDHGVDSDDPYLYFRPIIVCADSDINDIVTRYSKTLRARLKRKNAFAIGIDSKELADEFVNQCFRIKYHNYNLIISDTFKHLIINALISIGSDSAKDTQTIITNHFNFVDKLKQILTNEVSRESEPNNESVKADEEHIEECAHFDDEEEIFYDADSEFNYEFTDKTESNNTNSQSTQYKDIVNFIADQNQNYETEANQTIYDNEMEKLRQTYNNLKQEIEKYENLEINLNDANNMAILDKNDDLIQQLITVWEKICKLEGNQPISMRRVDEVFQFDFIKNSDIRLRLETEMNKLMLKNGFPDLPAIVEIVNSVITAKNMSSQPKFSDEEKVLQFCKNVFNEIGRNIQCRRQSDRHEYINQFLGNSDFNNIQVPETTDEVLKKKLEHNQKLSNKRMAEVFYTFESLERKSNRKKKRFVECAPKQQLFEQSGVIVNNDKVRRITPIQVLNATQSNTISAIADKNQTNK